MQALFDVEIKETDLWQRAPPHADERNQSGRATSRFSIAVHRVVGFCMAEITPAHARAIRLDGPHPIILEYNNFMDQTIERI